MLQGLPKMLNVLVCQLVISHCNQGFHMAFNRGHIWLSYDLHCLSISIEIRIFWANGPFKYFLPRIFRSSYSVDVNRTVGICGGLWYPPPQIWHPLLFSPAIILAKFSCLRVFAVEAWVEVQAASEIPHLVHRRLFVVVVYHGYLVTHFVKHLSEVHLVGMIHENFAECSDHPSPFLCVSEGNHAGSSCP